MLSLTVAALACRGRESVGLWRDGRVVLVEKISWVGITDCAALAREMRAGGQGV